MPESRTNQEWVDDLTASGARQEAAIADLRDILLRAALYFFSRNLGDFGGLGRDEIMHQAEDCAQDALIGVLQHLPEFRGDSKFSTWAYKFAINHAMMAARRQRWQGVSLDADPQSDESRIQDWMAQGRINAYDQEQSVIKDEIRDIMHEVIRRDLTDKQRRVLVLMVINEVPMDEVVRHLGANRNAVYKMLHDARQKMKKGLQSRGFEVAETLGLFNVQG